jgi:hypothetical protein
MNSKEYKKTFGKIAKDNGFDSAFGSWFKQSSDCIFVIELQKSNFGDYYEMNVKTFIQGAFNKSYVKNKDLAKKDMGDVFTRQPVEFRDVLDFDDEMSEEERILKTKRLFNDFIIPFSDKALSISGIKKLAEQKNVFLLPAVEKELERLMEQMQ